MLGGKTARVLKELDWVLIGWVELIFTKFEKLPLNLNQDDSDSNFLTTFVFILAKYQTEEKETNKQTLWLETRILLFRSFTECDSHIIISYNLTK